MLTCRSSGLQQERLGHPHFPLLSCLPFGLPPAGGLDGRVDGFFTVSPADTGDHRQAAILGVVCQSRDQSSTSGSKSPIEAHRSHQGNSGSQDGGRILVARVAIRVSGLPPWPACKQPAPTSLGAALEWGEEDTKKATSGSGEAAAAQPPFSHLLPAKGSRVPGGSARKLGQLPQERWRGAVPCDQPGSGFSALRFTSKHFQLPKALLTNATAQERLQEESREAWLPP